MCAFAWCNWKWRSSVEVVQWFALEKRGKKSNLRRSFGEEGLMVGGQDLFPGRCPSPEANSQPTIKEMGLQAAFASLLWWFAPGESQGKATGDAGLESGDL